MIIVRGSSRYIRVHNEESAKPFRWTKDAETIIGKVERAREALR